MKKKIKWNNEVAGWLFNVMYWFEATNVPKKIWRQEAFAKYVRMGISKKYSKGTFKKTWKYICKKGLIREGRKKVVRKKRRTRK